MKQNDSSRTPPGPSVGYNSLDPVRALLEHGWTDIDVIADLAGFPRVLAVRLE